MKIMKGPGTSFYNSTQNEFKIFGIKRDYYLTKFLFDSI